MTNRKKRMEKGIESIEEQIRFHEQKLEQARREGQIELADYYGHEIAGLKKTKDRKQKMLNK